jgi:hypothetical protein
MSFTYGQLKQALQDYLETSETTFVNNLPLFIRLSEERILKNVQLSLFRNNVSANATSGTASSAARRTSLRRCLCVTRTLGTIKFFWSLRTSALFKSIPRTQPLRGLLGTTLSLTTRTLFWVRLRTRRTRWSCTIFTALPA